MYLETIDEKAFRSFLSNPAISVLDGNVLDKYNGSNFYRFVRVPLSDGEHSVEALFGQMCSNYPTSMSKNHFYEQHNLEFMAYVVDHEKTYAESYEFLRLFDVTSAYTGPHSAMGEMTKTLWDYLEQKTILDPDYLNTLSNSMSCKRKTPHLKKAFVNFLSTLMTPRPSSSLLILPDGRKG